MNESNTEDMRILLDGHLRLELKGARLILHDSEGKEIAFGASYEKVEKQRVDSDLEQGKERFYASLIEKASDVLVVLDAEGMIIYANPRVEEAYGLKQSQVVGKQIADFFDLLHPDDAELINQAVIDMRDHPGSIERIEFRAKHPDGSWHCYEASSTNHLEDPLIKGVVTCTRDITERKRAEDSQRRSEEYYRSLTEYILDVIAVVDRDGTILHMSKSAERILGFSPEEVLGTQSLDFIHPDDIQKAVEGFDLADKNPGVSFTEEIRCRHKDGTWRTLEARGRSLLDNPSVKGIVASFTDITERKLAQERLERINQLFLHMETDIVKKIKVIIRTTQEILDGALVIYFRLDNGNASMLSTADAEQAFMHIDRPEDYICYEQMRGEAFSSLIVEDLRETPYVHTHPDIEKHGLIYYFGHPVETRKERRGCLGFFDNKPRDFTQDEINIFSILTRALSIEEERLSHEEGFKDFINVASHELRHPVTILKGYSISIKEKWDRLKVEQIKEMLDAMEASADRINQLTIALLDASRIEGGGLLIKKKAVALGPLIQRAIDKLGGEEALREFHISISENIGSVYADPDRLTDALVMLFSNAVKFSPLNSSIEIEVVRLIDEVSISVLDRGEGIKKKDKERIFERFYQAEKAMHHTKPGIGLGLYIARKIVEGHGGRIWCEQRDGGGSIFNVTLPA